MSALRLFFTVLLVMFVVEAGVMIVLPDVFPADVDPRWEAVPDAILLTLLCSPVLWWLLSERRRAEAERKARAHQQAMPSSSAAGCWRAKKSPTSWRRPFVA